MSVSFLRTRAEISTGQLRQNFWAANLSLNCALSHRSWSQWLEPTSDFVPVEYTVKAEPRNFSHSITGLLIPGDCCILCSFSNSARYWTTLIFTRPRFSSGAQLAASHYILFLLVTGGRCMGWQKV